MFSLYVSAIEQTRYARKLHNQKASSWFVNSSGNLKNIHVDFCIRLTPHKIISIHGLTVSYIQYQTLKHTHRYRCQYRDRDVYDAVKACTQIYFLSKKRKATYSTNEQKQKGSRRVQCTSHSLILALMIPSANVSHIISSRGEIYDFYYC